MTESMKQIRDLDATEIRVLGALLEKEQTTPDYYPLTVNSLIAACNQKSNRDPVTALTETEIVEALDALRVDVLAWRTDGARAEKWSQSISRRLELDPEEKAVLTLLMLRGPQTAGELRSRSGRLHSFDSLGEVQEVLYTGRLRSYQFAVIFHRQLRFALDLGLDLVHYFEPDDPEGRAALSRGSREESRKARR